LSLLSRPKPEFQAVQYRCFPECPTSRPSLDGAQRTRYTSHTSHLFPLNCRQIYQSFHRIKSSRGCDDSDNDKCAVRCCDQDKHIRKRKAEIPQALRLANATTSASRVSPHIFLLGHIVHAMWYGLASPSCSSIFLKGFWV
jgi:hypothetical protein